MEDNLKTKQEWKMTSIFFKVRMNNSKKGRRPNKIKWKMNQSTKINLIGCDTIVHSPSIANYWFSLPIQALSV